MVNLTGQLPPALGGEQETQQPPSYEPEMDLNKTQQFAGATKGELGLPEDLMEEVEDYVKNPPERTKFDSPIDAAIDAGYLITKYLSGIAEYNPEGNKAIRGMFKNALGVDPDWNPTEVAWCATFVSQVLSDLGADPLRSKDRYDRVRADKYRNYGSPVDMDNLTEGDIVVFDFDGDGRGDHATFYVGDREESNKNPDFPYISVLGGNQGDAVNIREYPKDTILATRRITYDDIDYEFTKELARDNADFNAFLKKEGEGFDMKSLKENPMSSSNTPMTSFDEGGFASKALDFLTSPLTGDYRKEKPTSVQMAELGVEASPVGTVGDIVEDPSLSNVAMSVAPDLLGLGPVKGVAKTLIAKKIDDIWSYPDQLYDSAETSINVSKKPAGYNELKKRGEIKEGDLIVDIGGGKFDNLVDDAAEQGATVKVYDPFNRSPEHNKDVVDSVRDGKADMAMSHNVLNVIQEDKNIIDIARQAENAVKPGGKAHFSVYEGTGKGEGKVTTKGYQRNQKTQDYIPLIEEVFGKGNVTRKGKIITATKKETQGFNQGGPVMNEQMEMAFMQEGGIKDDGMKRDPVSGNEIPPGSMASEVRDDIPAMLSEGEYVVPADVLRFYGVNFFENLRNKAKSGLQNMEANGRIGGEPLSPDQVQQNMSGQPQQCAVNGRSNSVSTGRSRIGSELQPYELRRSRW